MKKFLLSLFMLIPLMAWADDSGTAGECTWYFEDATGTLTFSGQGRMWDDWSYRTDNIINNTKTIIIEEGVTSVCWNGFISFTKLTSVTIPISVTQIGVNAFQNCTSLQTITIPYGSQIVDIGRGAFYGCDNLQTAYFTTSRAFVTHL